MRTIPTLLTILSMLVASTLEGQNCGCAEQGNCPKAFPPNSVTQVCYDITDAFNNNLADPNQGICGVAVKFRHSYVGSMELTLIAPNGTPVLLVDASGSCNTWTPLATWDIMFVPCSVPCKPDTINGCPYPCKFNACPPDCPWQNATFKGMYHPFAGCLENFNSGPVNGQWCLEINNSAPFNGGSILDFEIILCDQSGILCCDADAGNLAFEPDVNACLGDQSLLLELKPLYGAIVPDPAEYGYTYSIFEHDTILATYDTMPDLRAYPPGKYVVCGLSYLLADTTKMPLPGSVWTPTTLNDTLTGANPPFCGDIETNCIVVQIAAPLPPLSLNDTICVGDSVVVGSSVYKNSGIFSDTLTSLFGCDSIVNLSLLVVAKDTVSVVETICNGESVIIGNNAFSTSGTYQVTLQSQFGCDSTVLLNLTVLPPVLTFLTDTICFGDTVYVGNTGHAATGVFTDTLTSFTGCDSLVTLDLTVVFVSVSIAAPDTLSCQQGSVLLNASASTTLGSLDFQWSTSACGNIAGSTTTSSITVDEPCTYSVTVTSTGCTAADTVEVFADGNAPLAVALSVSPDTLTCAISSVQLDGSSSSGTGSLAFQWSSQGGSPVANPTSPTPTVTQPDLYILTITDSANGCVDTAHILIIADRTPPNANPGPDTVLSCSVTSIVLDATASMPAGILGFQWSTPNGNIVAGAGTPTPTIDRVGSYHLVVTNLVNDCRDTVFVDVKADTAAPQAVIALPFGNLLTCTTAQLTLDGSNSSPLSDAVFQWIGNIAAGQGTSQATVGSPGSYSLILTDTTNGCADTTFVTITQDTLSPQADAGNGGSISCSSLSLTLGAPGTSTGAAFTYQWTSQPAVTFPGEVDSAYVNVNTAATYFLLVTNQVNGCTALDSVVVSDNYNPPVAKAGPDGKLDCQNTSFLLDGSGSTIVPFTILEWRNSSGALISTTLQVSVDYADFFVLTVRFAFCISSDTVVVTSDMVPPTADAGTGVFLDCFTGLATLDGSASSAGPGISYEWTTSDGILISGINTTMPVAGAVGTYELTVTNNLNHCTATSMVSVGIDSVACMPLVDAGANGLVNCYYPYDTLQPNAPAGAAFSYAWAMLAGDSLNALNPFAPIVSPGRFVFCVSNTIVNLTACDTVDVVADTLAPVADAGPLILSLDCPALESCYQIDASNSSQGSHFTYQWESLNGTFCSPTDVLSPLVLGEGVYDLTIINQLNGCVGKDAVLIQLLDFYPVSAAGGNVQLTCGDTIFTLNANGSSTGGNYDYYWYSHFGQILSGGNTLNPSVALYNPVDTFFLVVTNNVNLCKDTSYLVGFAAQGCAPFCNVTVSGPLTCQVDTVVLDGSGSQQGADITYQWTALSGNLCSGVDSLVACANEAGIYQLTVTRTYPNGAAFSTSCQVSVADNSQLPFAEAGSQKTLTCTNASITLDGSLSETGAAIGYLWTTPDGNIVSGQTTKNPLVDRPGKYFLQVDNSATGCIAIDSVTVVIDTLHPMAEAGPPDQLTCTAGNVVLNGSSNLPGMAFQWTTSNGIICAGANTPNPIVCAAGTYYLTVRNPANGCTAVDSTLVTQASNVPSVNAGPDLFFTCADTVFIIAASAQGGAVLSYQWVALNGGCILGPSDVLQPTVACPGTYRLTVMDLLNGCVAVSQMNVIPANDPPTAHAGSPQEINCQALVVQLDGSASLPAGLLGFSWSTSGNGHIVAGANTATPTVDSAGIYQLIVTNLQNACKDTAWVTVTRDASIPVANAGPDTTLTCTRTTLKLNGLASSTGSSIVYQWKHLLPGGNPGNGILSGATTPTPTIDQTGTYVLTVLDTGSLCVVTDTVQVTLDTVSPSAIIDLSQPLTITCTINQLTLNGNLSTPTGNLSYQWTTSNGHIFSGANSALPVVDSGGWYTLTVRDLTNGCTHSAAAFVQEDFAKPPVVFAPSPVLDCDHPSVQPEVFPPSNQPIYTYAWNGPGIIADAQTPTPTVNKAGVYSVTITNTGNGCKNEGLLTVSENFLLPQAVANSLGVLDCDSLMVNISGAGSSASNVSYVWTTTSGGTIQNATALVARVDAPGWYYLTVSRLDNGCTATDSTEVIASALPIDKALLRLDPPDCLDPDGFIFVDSVLGGTPPYFYSLDGDVFITYPQFSYLDAGFHEVVVEDVNGCNWSVSVYLPGPEEIVVELGDDIFIKQGEGAELSAQISIPPGQLDTVIWQGLPYSVECPPCLEHTVFPMETTVYTIKIVDTTGCWATDKVTVWVNEERPFYVPTAFSPNGDGSNDLLVLYASRGIAAVNVFRIFDRWGNLVFQAEDFPPNNPAHGWNGNFNSTPMNPAVFVWMAEVTFLDGTRRIYYGDTTLIR